MQPDYLGKTLKPILIEFKQFVQLIKLVHKVLRVPNLTNEAYSSRQVIVGVWKKANKIYILMINNWPVEREVSFPLIPYVNNARLNPILSTRDIPNLRVKNGTVRLNVLPWETFVWEVDTTVR